MEIACRPAAIGSRVPYLSAGGRPGYPLRRPVIARELYVDIRPDHAHNAAVANWVIVLNEGDYATLRGHAYVADPGRRFVAQRADGKLQPGFSLSVVTDSE